MDRNLKAFIIVAEVLNVTHAAKLLHITQPTLTKRLQQLETQYSCSLFERLPRGIKLTTYGQHLLYFAKRIEAEYLQADEQMASLKSGHLEYLNIGAGPLFHLNYLGQCLVQLRKEFPKTKITLRAELNTRNLHKLYTGELDIVFGTTEHMRHGDQIQFDQLTTVEQGVLLNANHQLAGLETISIEKLTDVEWIVYSDAPDNVDLLKSYFISRGLKEPVVAMQTSSLALGLQMVAVGGYALSLPVQLKSILQNKNLSLVKLSPSFAPRASGAFTRKSSHYYPIIKKLIEIVKLAIEND